MYEHLGKLSEQFESGGKGCGTVSSGKGDPGGVSYGTYQFATNTGSADKFVQNSKFAHLFAGYKAGTPEFTAVWKTLAELQPKEFAIAQHDAIAEKYYLPLCQSVKEIWFLDVTERPIAVQDMVWSIAVQHGPKTSLIHNAISKHLNGRQISASDEDFVKAVYAERMLQDSSGTLQYFKKATSKNRQMRESLLSRFEKELYTTLKRLSGELTW